MNLDRRRAIGFGGAAWLTLASGVRAAPLAPAQIRITAPGRSDAAPLLKALSDYAAAELAAWGVPGMTIVARGDRLVLEGAGDLALAGDGSWRLAESPCERLWFDAPLGGRMQRLNYSGGDMLRFNDVSG